jgi:hypothetical protein
MTAEEYQKQYGVAPTATPRALTLAPEAKEGRGLVEDLVKRPLERLVIEPAVRTGQAIGSAVLTPFLNDEQKARMDKSLSEDSKIQVPFFGEFIARRLKGGAEGFKQIAGETLEAGAYAVPSGQLAKATAPAFGKLGGQVAAGAATGYAFDAGSKLQEGASVQEALKPGVGAATGAALPFLGRIIGGAPKRLEEVNLRMTPTEKNILEKKGKDIAQWVASRKISGSPEVRYQKVNTIYDDLERQVSTVVDGSKITFPKVGIIDQLKAIPAKYADNLSEYDGVVSKVTRMIKTLEETRGDSISGSALNKMKRAEWKNAYNKNGSAVINEVSDDVAHSFKTILDDAIPALKKINPEYGNAIEARKILFRAINRNQTGLVGKLLGMSAGAGIGGAVGGGVGAAGGAIVGEQIAAKALGTATRSRAGAAIQSVVDILSKIPTDKDGNLQIPQKALILLLQNLVEPDIEPASRQQ